MGFINNYIDPSQMDVRVTLRAPLEQSTSASGKIYEFEDRYVAMAKEEFPTRKMTEFIAAGAEMSLQEIRFVMRNKPDVDKRWVVYRHYDKNLLDVIAIFREGRRQWMVLICELRD